MIQRGWDAEDWIFLIVAAVAAACMALAVNGCGASGLQVQSRAADGVGVVIEEAREVVRLQIRGGMIACGEREEPGLAFEECVAAVRKKWEPATEAHRVADASHGAWLSALVAAQAIGNEDGLSASALLRLVRPLLGAYARLREAALALGLDIPPLPEVPL